MNKNIKSIFFVLTLFTLLLGVSVVSAIDANNDTHISEDTSDVIAPEVTTTTKGNTVENTKNVERIKNDNEAIIVNNDTARFVFSGENNSLNESIKEADTLDFQGTISKVDGLNSILINKPINIITSTNNGRIENLNSITYNNGASGSNITGIYTYNTQFYVRNAHNIVFDNISNVVVSKAIGWGVGQTSIGHNSTNITVKNSYFYTKDNGGSSTFVFNWADNSTLVNSTVEADGNVGNLVYLTTYNVDLPSGTTANCNNQILNNTIRGPEKSLAICWAIALSGNNNTVDGNTIHYVGTGITGQWGSGITGEGIDDNATSLVNNSNHKIFNNKLYTGTGFTGITGCILINNTFYNNSRFRIGNDSLVINNTANNLEVMGTNSIIRNNNITNNQTYTINGTGTNNTIKDNYLTSLDKYGDESVNLNKELNTIANNTPIVQNIIITDETYSDFFDDESNIKLDVVKNYTKIYLTGEIYNKDFKFNNIITNIYNNQSILYNSTLELNENSKVKIEKLTINNTDKKALIINAENSIIKENTIYAYAINNITELITINADNTVFENNNIYYNQSIETENPIVTLKINSENNNITTNTIQIINQTKVSNPVVDNVIINGVKYEEIIQNMIIDEMVSYDTTAYINNSTFNIVDTGDYESLMIGNDSFINNSHINAFLVADGGLNEGLKIIISNSTLNGGLILLNNAIAYIDDTVILGENFYYDDMDGTLIDDTCKVITNNTQLIDILSQKGLPTENINDTNRFTIDPTTSTIPTSPDTNPEVKDVIINGVKYEEIIQNMIIDEMVSYDTTAYINNSTFNIVDTGDYESLMIGNDSFINNSHINAFLVADGGLNEGLKIIISNSTLNGGLILLNNAIAYIDDTVILGENFYYDDMDGTLIDDTCKVITNNTQLIDILSQKGLPTENINDTNRFTIDPTTSTIPTQQDNTPVDESPYITNEIMVLNGKNNYVYNNYIYVNSTGAIHGIIINSDDNKVIRNTLRLRSNDNITAVDIINANDVDVSRNPITITKSNNTYGIVIENSSIANNIQSNTITITADNTASAIILEGSNIKDENISSNTLRVTANNSIGIAIKSKEDKISNITVDSNTVHVKGQTANALLINANNIIMKNTLNVTIIANDENSEEIDDNIISSAILIINSDNITQNSSYTDIYTNTASLILINTSNSNINYIRNKIITNETPILIINSTNNTITNCELNTTQEYTIIGESSTNNIIENNYLIAKTLTGDESVKLNKETNTIANNTPKIELIIDTTEFTPGQTTTIKAGIYFDGEILTDNTKGKVTFKVDGKTLKDTNGKVIYAKIVNGQATIENYVVPDTWKEDSTIQAVYSGSTQCDKLTSEKTEITINKEAPTFTIDPIEPTAAGSTITLKATITDNNKVINTGKVVFKINGKTVKDENGKVIYAKVVNNQVEFEYTLPDSYKAGSYNITATFISADYERLEDSKTLTVN